MSKQWAAFGAGPWAGFAFGRGGRFFESGEVRLAILSLLGEGPKHGYQLMKELAERSGGVYKASAGSVYPTLQQLEDEGLIEAEQQSGRRVYHLTAAGRRELKDDPESVRRIWERAERCEDWGQFFGPDTITLWPPLAALVKAGVQAAGRVGRTADGVERVRSILDRTRRDLDSLK
jgi:DNA-binding PadR family transcriptional regulator